MPRFTPATESPKETPEGSSITGKGSITGKVVSALAVSVDGRITGRDPRAGEGLVDELILHQVPVLLGAGRPFFQELPEHIRLTVAEVVPAAGVTHIRYEVQK